MQVYDFMFEIKERLQAAIPNADVVVEPNDNESVSITLRWWAGPRYGAQKIVPIRKIMQGNGDIASFYVALFEKLKADVMATEGQK